MNPYRKSLPVRAHEGVVCRHCVHCCRVITHLASQWECTQGAPQHVDFVTGSESWPRCTDVNKAGDCPHFERRLTARERRLARRQDRRPVQVSERAALTAVVALCVVLFGAPLGLVAVGMMWGLFGWPLLIVVVFLAVDPPPGLEAFVSKRIRPD